VQLWRTRILAQTKIHAAEMPGVGRSASPTQGFLTLLRMTDDRIPKLVGDKGYNSDTIRAELRSAGIEPVIPAPLQPPATHLVRPPCVQGPQPPRADVQQAEKLAARRHATTNPAHRSSGLRGKSSLSDTL